MVLTEIIVRAAAEGGSLTIEGKHCGSTGWQLRMVRDETTLLDFCVDAQEPAEIAGFVERMDYCDSLGEALKQFDKYPEWINLYPIEVHPAFVDEVLAAVKSRGGASAETRWREVICRSRRLREHSESNQPALAVDDSFPNGESANLGGVGPLSNRRVSQVAMDAPPSAVGRLLREISWEGNARRYRCGGQGQENVLTVEVFQALDFLPRGEFLGRIFRSAQGGTPDKLNLLADQVEELAFSLLPGDIDLASDPPKGKGRLHLQPDGILHSPLVYCMLEAKRIKRGAFQQEQLAKEFLAVLQEAGNRSGTLFLVLPEAPPISVRKCGRLALREAIANWLPGVLERADGEFLHFDELCSAIDSTIVYTTWPRVYAEVEGALDQFSSPDPSVRRSVSRLANSILRAIVWHS